MNSQFPTTDDNTNLREGQPAPSDILRGLRARQLKLWEIQELLEKAVQITLTLGDEDGFVVENLLGELRQTIWYSLGSIVAEQVKLVDSLYRDVQDGAQLCTDCGCGIIRAGACALCEVEDEKTNEV